MVTTITDIVPESAHRDDKYSDDGIDEHDLDLRQIPSDAPGMPATIEDGVSIPPDGGYGWVCVACGFMVGSLFVYLALWSSTGTDCGED